MKKHILPLLLCGLAVLLLCSCGEDYSDYPQSIIGEWKTEEDPGRYEVFVFNSDGSGKYTVVVGEDDSMQFEFTYTLDKNILTRRTGNEEVVHTVSIKGDKMSLTAGKDKVVLRKTQ